MSLGSSSRRHLGQPINKLVKQKKKKELRRVQLSPFSSLSHGQSPPCVPFVAQRQGIHDQTQERSPKIFNSLISKLINATAFPITVT